MFHAPASQYWLIWRDDCPDDAQQISGETACRDKSVLANAARLTHGRDPLSTVSEITAGFDSRRRQGVIGRLGAEI